MNSELRRSTERKFSNIKDELMETTSAKELDEIKLELKKLRYECLMIGYLDIVRDIDRILK